MKISDEKLIDSLLQNGSFRATAKVLSISPTTISKRLADPSFRVKYESAKSQLLTSAVDEMRNSLSTAIETLRVTMGDETAPPSVRVQSADLLLRHFVKYYEITDISERISKLEELSRNERL